MDPIVTAMCCLCPVQAQRGGYSGVFSQPLLQSGASGVPAATQSHQEQQQSSQRKHVEFDSQEQRVEQHNNGIQYAEEEDIPAEAYY